jgi:hypothetical protein
MPSLVETGDGINPQVNRSGGGPYSHEHWNILPEALNATAKHKQPSARTAEDHPAIHWLDKLRQCFTASLRYG